VSVWDEVVGQPRAVATLQEAAAAAHLVVTGEQVAAGSMTHAWLFTGPPGSGRSVAARAFAAALQCEVDGTGCGVCPGCHTVRSRTHADVHIVVPEGLSIAVQEMR
jgi:DNA polymerase-3 subunit delta'